jgi:hypothetical protein
VWFAWGAENDEIEVPKKSAETGGHRVDHNKKHWSQLCLSFSKLLLP